MCSSTKLYWRFLFAIILTCTGANQVHKDLSPINIITSKVTTVLGERPITAGLSLTDVLFPIAVTNYGTAIILSSLSSLSRTPLTFGGPLLNNEKYFLAYQEIYVNQSMGRSGHEINGKGYPIEVVSVFYNQKYRFLEEATKYHDGVLLTSQPVRVQGTINNTAFIPTENVLRSGAVRKPYSTGYVSSLSSFLWYDSILFERAFYVYRGSYYYPPTKTQICSALYLITQQFFYNVISISQAFQNVLDFSGKPINVVPPIHSQGSRKIERARGVIVELVPFGISIPLP